MHDSRIVWRKVDATRLSPFDDGGKTGEYHQFSYIPFISLFLNFTAVEARCEQSEATPNTHTVVAEDRTLSSQLDQMM